MDTESIDRLFLELSQFTNATTQKELQLQADVNFLLSFAPSEQPVEGLDPTFYHTGTHEGDMANWRRLIRIRVSGDNYFGITG